MFSKKVKIPAPLFDVSLILREFPSEISYLILSFVEDGVLGALGSINKYKTMLRVLNVGNGSNLLTMKIFGRKNVFDLQTT